MGRKEEREEGSVLWCFCVFFCSSGGYEVA